MKHGIRILILCGALLIAPVWALAASACPEIAQKALEAADKLCASAGRNQACYGNVSLTAEAQPGAQNFTFEKAGDIVNVAALKTLKLSPMDETSGKWGVALLRLQANLPDTLPGQNVTFLVFGDVELTNAVDANDTTKRPMQAFYLRSGVKDAPCSAAPESGLLVQTPEGVGEVSLTINEVNVQLGSTVFFQSDGSQSGEMEVSTLEGAAYFQVGDETHPVVPGAQLRVRGRRLLGGPQAAAAAPAPGAESTLDPLSLPSGGGPTPAFEPEAFNENGLKALPLKFLKRKVNLPPALKQDDLKKLRARIAAGGRLCGVDPFPSCDRFRQPPENPRRNPGNQQPNNQQPGSLPTQLPALPSLPNLPKPPGTRK
jgi:hypothetical protein